MSLDSQHTQPPLLSLAFRPLFLGGTLFAIAAVAWWVYFWLSPFDWQPYGGAVWWHAHEMLFGFGAAIVGGFLLTAVANWTGIPALRGMPLLTLVSVWLMGRFLMAFKSGLPQGLIISIELLYTLMVAMAMAYPIIKARQWRNIAFLPLLLGLVLLNGMSHWGVATNNTELAMQTLHATIMWFVLIIAFVGGRVIAAFTATTTGCSKALPLHWLERVSTGSIILMLLIAWAGFSSLPSWVLFLIAASAALANGWRFLRWGFQHCAAEPLLWSLHLAYAFIPIGFAGLALYSLGWMNNLSAVLHSFTVGAMGGMILAMIARVTLGHTGRPLEPPRLIPLAFASLLLAALLRVVVPVWLPTLTLWGIALAGGLWVLAYAIYLSAYAPMLLGPDLKKGSD